MSNASWNGKIENMAGPLTELSVSDGNIANLTVQALQASDIALDNKGYTEKVVVGFAPTGFGTTAAAGIVNLKNAPGQAAATVNTDAQLLNLPAGAVVTRVLVDSNLSTITSGGAPTFDVGHGTFGAATSDWIAAAALATVNATGGAYRSFIAGSTGVATGHAPVTDFATTVVNAGDGFVFVQVNTAALTAGDMRAVIHYYELAHQGTL